MGKKLKRNIYFSICILIGILFIQLLNVFLFYSMHYVIESIARALGGFLLLISIPLLISIVAKLFFKKLFWGVLWKTLAIITIPLCIISFHGAYIEHKKSATPTTKTAPREYRPSENELKEFQSKAESKSFLNMEQVNNAIKKFPSNAINHYNRGILYTSMLKHEKAIKDYSKAIDLDPNFAGAYLNRSVEYLFLNDFSSAFMDCSKAIELNPNLSEAFFNRANIMMHLGKTTESLEDLKRAARLGNAEAIKLLSKNNIKWN